MTFARATGAAFLVSATFLAGLAQPVDAQLRLVPRGDSTAATVAPEPIDYSEFAGLALASPVVADVIVRGADRIKGPQAVGLAPGMARFYVTGDVGALIRGPAGLPVRLSWLVDMPADAKGRAAGPRKKDRLLLFARTLPDRAAMLQLIGPTAQRRWSAEADRTVRAILTEALAADTPPVITGVGNAFFVPGALPGEGETQIFLTTSDGRPVSLSVIRDPAGQRNWSVALSEVTAAAAPPPARDTLLWYRLACALPAELPAASAVDDVADNAARARADYAFVIQSLGRCAYPIKR